MIIPQDPHAKNINKNKRANKKKLKNLEKKAINLVKILANLILKCKLR